VEVAELMGHAVERLADRLADRVLAVGDHAGDRHRERLFDRGDEPGQVVPGRGQEAPGQQDLTTEAVTQDPEDLVADVGLEAVDGQDHPAGGRGEPAEPLGIGESLSGNKLDTQRFGEMV
jgi:hypothetical protein